MTKQLSERLKLKRTGREVVQLAAFVSSARKVSHIDNATVFLLSDTKEKIAVDVMTVPTIAILLRNIQYTISTLPYLQGLKLAHPVTKDDTFNISLLNSADKFWDMVGNRVISGYGPVPVQSKIGYLFSGPLLVSSIDMATDCILHVIISQPDSYDLEHCWKLRVSRYSI